MPTFLINNKPGFEEWKQYARYCLENDLPPPQIQWRETQTETTLTLFNDSVLIDSKKSDACSPPQFRLPSMFMEKAKVAICHASPKRFNLLYRVLWRLQYENPKLLHYLTDPDILALETLIKAVHRDAYKIKAYLRFREITFEDQSHFVSWYEPEHYTLELSLPFFQERFKNMRWSILTPYRAAHWDREKLTLTHESHNKELYPAEDTIEAYWVQYYASIFNPARLKTKAMLSQMPKKYWHNMPETAQIESLIKESKNRVRTMLETPKH